MPRVLSVGLLVGNPAWNPVGVGVVDVALEPAGRVGAGEASIELGCRALLMLSSPSPSSSSPLPPPMVGLGIGTPTETGGLVSDAGREVGAATLPLPSSPLGNGRLDEAAKDVPPTVELDVKLLDPARVG